MKEGGSKVKIEKGDKVIFQGKEYIVLERKSPKCGKGKFYLYDIKSRKYLSSLYPDGEGYIFDDGEFYYRLEKVGDFFGCRVVGVKGKVHQYYTKFTPKNKKKEEVKTE